ncbi:(2R)-sulfolactate sulfo-lyase subunit alpha [Fodinibius roseus]|uniref:(2R)-sulfolactate sulfo-lyase subunit alpha n=1 Tax=Fodinibius roseus TaxID=1194090 RepID=A0A1M5LVY0_9BACT|nr:UxaA family hydrolase [Fodinibius roseus]SHG69282.1 (2R)-sulfolactate sulfo-lyase subunit alpha [Fodinibius roseus]
MIEYVMHDEEDNVGVVVVDIDTGQLARGRTLHGNGAPEVKALSEIPLGHKIALRDFEPGDTIIKYGVDIGQVVEPIKTGEHVHVHNLKTKRW